MSNQPNIRKTWFSAALFLSFGQKTKIRIFDILSFHKIFSMVVYDVAWEGQCGSQQGLKGAALPIAVSCNMVTLIG